MLLQGGRGLRAGLQRRSQPDAVMSRDQRVPRRPLLRLRPRRLGQRRAGEGGSLVSETQRSHASAADAVRYLCYFILVFILQRRRLLWELVQRKLL